MKIDNGQDDWIGVDESVETIKVEKRKPILIEDMGAISAVVKKYQEKDYLIYNLDRAANVALNTEREQPAAAIAAYREIGKLIGHYEPKKIELKDTTEEKPTSNFLKDLINKVNADK
jgi:hypothetical protein